MKEYKEFSEMFPEDLDIKDLNEFIEIVLNKFVADESISEYDLECWGEYIENLMHEKYPDSNKMFVIPEVELGWNVIKYISWFSIGYVVNRYDVPTLLEYLNTPYENEKQAYEKLKEYFEHKFRSTNFFNHVFSFYMYYTGVVIFRGRQGIDNKPADENLNKFFDFLFDTKIIETGIPYGTVYEIFKNEEMVCSVTNFVNEQLEVESKVESQDNELRELLEYFVGVKLYRMENLKELIHFDHHSKVYENISRAKKKLDKVGQGELYTINKNEEVIGSLENIIF